MTRLSMWAVLSLSATLLFSCSKASDQPLPKNEKEGVEQAEAPSLHVANIYVDDHMASLLEESLPSDGIQTKSEELNGILDAIGAKKIERLFPDTGRFEERRRAFGLHRWYRIAYSPDVTATKAAEGMAQVDGIEVFEADKPIKFMDELPFNDPSLAKQWQYRNDGSGAGWQAKVDINVFPVWKNYTTGSPDVIVGVVDGGIDIDHEDLAGAVDKDNSWNFCTGNKIISAHSHGTHVAGTIGAINNNGLGVSGVAGGDAAAGVKGVTMLSLQIFSNNDGGGSGASGIVWAADHGAVICNNSWGYDFEKDDGTMDRDAAKELHEFFAQPNEGKYKDSVKDAIDYFNANAGMDENGNQEGPMAGGVVFFSAGNDAWQWGPPANYPGAVAVGAYGPTGAKAYYSTYGTKDDDWVDVAAPGGDAYTTQILSTLPGNSYGYFQGTSMACPHASGVAALIVSALGGPGFTREMLIGRMLNSPNPNINLGSSRIGVPVDALGAITYGEEPDIPESVTDLKAVPSSNNVNVSWSVTASSKGTAAYAYRLFYGTDRGAVEASTAAAPGAGVKTVVVETGTVAKGKPLSTTLTLDFETEYFFKVLGYDYNLNYSGNSNIASAVTEANNPPAITPLSSIDGLKLKSFESTSINFTVSDPDGHDFTIDYQAGSGSDSWQLLPIGQYQMRIVGAVADPGTYTATIKATDSYGKASSLKVTYTILENNPPVVGKPFENILFSEIGATRSIALADHISDPDGEALSYSVNNTAANVAHAAIGSGKLNVTALDYGLSTITVTGSDAKKKEASASFKVLVREAGVEMQAYPTTVTTTLHIGTGETLQSTSIRVVSQTGGVFFDGTLECSAFEPAEIDMKNAAPGKYSVIVTFGGKEYRQNIVKK